MRKYNRRQTRREQDRQQRRETVPQLNGGILRIPSGGGYRIIKVKAKY